jgi:hypothetical protein
MNIDRIIDAMGFHEDVRCWPWERARFYVESPRTMEADADAVWIGATLEGGREERHARAKLDGRVLRAYERTGSKGFLVDALRDVLSDLADRVSSQVAYMKPPKGWRKFGRIKR